jgi:hypothetical protein
MTDVSRYCVECERLQAGVDALRVDYGAACSELEDCRVVKSARESDCVVFERVVDGLRVEVDRMRPVVQTAEQIVDADLSVYDDVPEAHDLMNQLDRDVYDYRAVKGADDDKDS